MIRLPKYPKFGAGEQAARVHGVAARLGLDLGSFGARSAAITGSNGKGSTAAMLASILSAAGRRTARFTSPHLFAINERFWIDGGDISDDTLSAQWARVEEAADGWLAAHRDQQLGGFEFLFLVAASVFEGCDCIVWEAGIGGRRDVTRLVEPRRAAITSIDLEHTHLLGETREAIALDKADVAPARARLFLGGSARAFEPQVRAHAAERGVIVQSVAPLAVELPLAGEHQRANAALAVALAHDMGVADTEAIARGLAAMRWPGRLERIGDAPPVVIDVGHTPDAIDAALAGFRAMGFGEAVLVCGASADKDGAGLVARLAPAFREIVATRAHHKGRDAAEIAAFARAANPDAAVSVAPDISEAASIVLARGKPAYVAGGLFVAAEFKAAFAGRDPGALRFF